MAKNTNENVKSLTKKELREQQKKKRRRMKAVKDVILMILIIGVVVGAFIGLLYAAGTFDYHPQATYHVAITIEDYGSLHVELYGNDAPETVAHFMELVEGGYYNGKSVYKLFDDLAYIGTELSSGEFIKGEFSENGFNNRISHERGVLSMERRGEGSSYGGFFIVKEDSPELDGKYAAFGKVTSGMDVIDKIFEDLETDANGMIDKANRPKITGIVGHESHGH